MSADLDESVSRWIIRLAENSPEAAQRVWAHYHSRLLGMAARMLSRAARGSGDEEDVVASVFESFFERAGRGELPPDARRDDLWRLLARMVEFKSASHNRLASRQKRGGGLRRISADADEGFDPLSAVPSPDLPPDLAAEVADSVQHLLDLLDSEQQRIVALKLQGFTNEEIAVKIDKSRPTIERRLKLVREHWKDWLDGQSDE